MNPLARAVCYCRRMPCIRLPLLPLVTTPFRGVSISHHHNTPQRVELTFLAVDHLTRKFVEHANVNDALLHLCGIPDDGKRRAETARMIYAFALKGMVRNLLISALARFHGLRALVR